MSISIKLNIFIPAAPMTGIVFYFWKAVGKFTFLCASQTILEERISIFEWTKRDSSWFTTSSNWKKNLIVKSLIKSNTIRIYGYKDMKMNVFVLLLHQR